MLYSAYCFGFSKVLGRIRYHLYHYGISPKNNLVSDSAAGQLDHFWGPLMLLTTIPRASKSFVLQRWKQYVARIV